MTVKILNDFRGQSKSPIKPQNFLAPDSADGFFFSLFLARNWSFDVVFGSFIFQILLWRIFWAQLLPWSTVPIGISSHHERYQMLLLFKAPFLKGTVIYFLDGIDCTRLSWGQIWKCFGSAWREFAPEARRSWTGFTPKVSKTLQKTTVCIGSVSLTGVWMLDLLGEQNTEYCCVSP